ncbi:hypothetical protein F5Y10DRAFT_272142 [Nemania abortiva]|nr:hypothetical protein F5Y10DRAFT_272142 [Nemania abortiva]
MYVTQLQNLRNPHETIQTDTANIPFEDYVGRFLQGQRRKYHIKPRCWDDGDLVVFLAVSHDGELCEAQFFKKGPLPRKLYLSRKRRIQRLKRSANFMDDVNQEDVRILVSRVSQGKPFIGEIAQDQAIQRESVIR